MLPLPLDSLLILVQFLQQLLLQDLSLVHNHILGNQFNHNQPLMETVMKMMTPLLIPARIKDTDNLLPSLIMHLPPLEVVIRVSHTDLKLPLLDSSLLPLHRIQHQVLIQGPLHL